MTYINPKIHTKQNIKLLKKYLSKSHGEEKAIKMIKKAEEMSNEDDHDYLFGSESLAYYEAKNNLEFFSMYYLQDVFLNAEDSTDIAPIHREIWQDIEDMLIRKTHDKQAYILPRGTGKSVFGNLSTVIFSTVFKYKRYTVVCSSIGSTAQKFVKQIKDAIIDNPFIEHTFGTLLEPNNKKYICNNNQLEFTNRCMVESISSTSSMRGRKYGNFRIELAILDDYQDENDVSSVESRDRKWRRFSDDVSYAMQKNNSTIIGLGTLQHPEDFYSKLLKLPTWKSRVEKGVLVDDLEELFTTDHWGEIQKIFKSNNENKLEAAKEYYSNHYDEMQFPMLWDSFWDCFDMAEAYFEDPESFEQEIQSVIRSQGRKKFQTIITEKPETIETHDFTKTVLSIDPAGSRNKRKGDFYAFSVASVADTGIKYVRKGEIHRFEFEDYMSKTLQLLKDYPDIEVINIEKQTYSGSDVIRLQQLISEDNELNNNNYTWVNRNQTKNKDDKIATIVGDVNMGRIIFNEEDEEAIQQLQDFAGVDYSLHDDFPDVVAESSLKLDEFEEVAQVKFLDRSLLF